MCPDGFNQKLWNSCFSSALDNKKWAEEQITKYPDYLTNPTFTDIARKQITYFKDTPTETIAKEEYDFFLMMARHQTEFKSAANRLRIDPFK